MTLARLLVAASAGFGLTYLGLAGAWREFGLALAVAAVAALAVEALHRSSLTSSASWK